VHFGSKLFKTAQP